MRKAAGLAMPQDRARGSLPMLGVPALAPGIAGSSSSAGSAGALPLSACLGVGVFLWEGRCEELMPLQCSVAHTCRWGCEASLFFGGSGRGMPFFLRRGNLKGGEGLAVGLIGQRMRCRGCGTCEIFMPVANGVL